MRVCRQSVLPCRVLTALLLLLVTGSYSFNIAPRSVKTPGKLLKQPSPLRPPPTNHWALSSSSSDSSEYPRSTIQTKDSSSSLIPKVLLTSVFVACLAWNTATDAAHAYNPSDYASETVQDAISLLKQSGSAEDTLKAYETIAEIITEGKGVGGNINYQGINLERGYVADEDTTIYNPGLTLLTESEKERLVDGIIQSRETGLSKNHWTENNQAAYEELKGKLDPLHMNELQGYLQVLPLFGAVLYLGVLAIQQNFRDIFAPVYLAAAAIIFGPVVALVALSP